LRRWQKLGAPLQLVDHHVTETWWCNHNLRSGPWY
jgi:hypothetical protein